jgi:hypothetical protein
MKLLKVLLQIVATEEEELFKFLELENPWEEADDVIMVTGPADDAVSESMREGSKFG